DVMVVAEPLLGREAPRVGRAGKQRVGLFERLGAAGETAEQRARPPRRGTYRPMRLAESPAMRHHLRGALQFGDKRGKLVVIGTGGRDIQRGHASARPETSPWTASFLLAA